MVTVMAENEEDDDDDGDRNAGWIVDLAVFECADEDES
jgi:hypothetical protein